jgi:hypothetical protein
MSRYSNDNGCFTIVSIVGFLLLSIIKVFEGQFIPIIIVISIALILWFENIYVKHKSERKKLAETPEGRKEIDTNNSKLFIVIIIIVIGVIISMIFQSNKREYFENKKNAEIEYVPSTIQTKIDIDTTEKKIVKEETVWLNKINFDYNFKLPKNFIQSNDLTNDNFYLYVDRDLYLSLSIASGNIDESNQDMGIEQFVDKLPEFAQNFNFNNKKNFDDFKLIDYKMSKLGNTNAIKITQSSRKVSGKNIEMKVVSYNLIAKLKYYDITYSYPKDSIKYDSIFKKIEESFEFKTE